MSQILIFAPLILDPNLNLHLQLGLFGQVSLQLSIFVRVFEHIMLVHLSIPRRVPSCRCIGQCENINGNSALLVPTLTLEMDQILDHTMPLLVFSFDNIQYLQQGHGKQQIKTGNCAFDNLHCHKIPPMLRNTFESYSTLAFVGSGS